MLRVRAPLVAVVSSGGTTLSPSLFTNSQTFFGPVVTTVATISPSLFTNSQTFYSPTVTTAGSLFPSLFTNSQTFYSPTLTHSDKTLTPNLLTNTQVFYAPALKQDQFLTPVLFTNTGAFYSPNVFIPGDGQTLVIPLTVNATGFSNFSIDNPHKERASLFQLGFFPDFVL